MHLRRIVVEQAGQALAIGTGLLDRLLFTAVMIRTWGDARFEAWATCIAAAGLVSLFEFGFCLYFNNRLMEETEQQRHREAHRTFFIANTLFGLAGVVSFVCVAVLVLVPSIRGGGPEIDTPARLAILVLAAGQSLRIATFGCLSLYRANRESARLALLLTAGEVARIALSIAACLAGGGLLAVALTGTLAAVVLQIVFPVYDVLRRFPPHRFGFSLIHRAEIRPIATTSSGFLAQSIPIVLLTSLPVLYVEETIGVGVLATFVLMRTLSGLPRSLLQQLAGVLGQECGRCVAAADDRRALKVVMEGGHFYSILSGAAAGLLVGAGVEIVSLWTGTSIYFRLHYLLAGVSSMILTPFAVLAHNILTNSNSPFLAAAGRWTQLVITISFAALAPIEDTAFRMLLALSVGEVVGFAPFAYFGVRRLVLGTDAWFYVKDVLLASGVALLAFALTRGILLATSPQTISGRATAVMFAVGVVSGLIVWLGVRADTRRALFHHFVQDFASVPRVSR